MIYLFWLIVVVCIGLAVRSYVKSVDQEPVKAKDEAKSAAEQFKYDPDE